MLFVGGPWHARDEALPEDVPHWAVYAGGERLVYTAVTFAMPGIGYKRIMVAPVFLGTPLATREALKDALLERWLKDG